MKSYNIFSPFGDYNPRKNFEFKIVTYNSKLFSAQLIKKKHYIKQQ